MPKRKRIQREHTEDWQTIQQYTLWPEQTAYELLRPKSRPGKRPFHKVQNVMLIIPVVLRQDTYLYQFFDEGNVVEDEGTTYPF